MRARVGVLTAAAAALLMIGAAAPATAAPRDVIDGGAPGLLWLEVDAAISQVDLDPGESAYRLVTLHLDTEPSAALSVQLTSTGSLASDPDGLQVGIDECTTPWGAPLAPGGPPSCAAGLTAPLPLVAFSTLAAGDWRALGVLDEHTPRYLRITLALPDSLPTALRGGRADYQLAFAAAGDVVPVVGPPTSAPKDLAWTGWATAVPLGLAVVLGGAGALLRAAERKRHV